MFPFKHKTTHAKHLVFKKRTALGDLPDHIKKAQTIAATQNKKRYLLSQKDL